MSPQILQNLHETDSGESDSVAISSLDLRQRRIIVARMFARPANFLLAFIFAGWALGGIEGAVGRGDDNRALAVFMAASLASVPGFVLGLAGITLVVTFKRVPASAAVSTWFDRLNSADSTADREPVIKGQSLLLVAFIVFTLTGLASSLIYPALFRLQVKEVGQSLAVVVSAILVMGGLGGASLLIWLLRRPLLALDKRWGLPQPRQVWARYLLFVVVPVFVGLYPILLAYGSMLSFVRDAALLFLLSLLALLFAQWLNRAPRIVGFLGLAISVLLLMTTVLIYQRFEKAANLAGKSQMASLGSRMARFITDVDRDGASAFLGGGDCASFNSKRYPGAVEISDNGIDEDCDGQDGKSSKGQTLPAAALMSGALRSDQIKQYNIVWVVIDAVRADHLPTYGYSRPTMPNLDMLAKESLVFEQAYSQASATLFSIPSMLAGVDPGVMTWGTDLPQPQTTPQELLLGERLKALGYQTGAVVENYLRYNFPGMLQGFDTVLVGEPDTTRAYNRPRRAPFATIQAADWLARLQPKQKFFLFQYYVDPHGTYYDHPDVDSNLFKRDDRGPWAGNMTPQLYDKELLFTDRALGALVGILRANQDIWNNTILIVSSDHGEEFYEHGTHSHSTSCYRESVHVPLVVRIPGFAPQRINTPVALVDIVPTLLELIGGHDELDRLAGQSLLVPVLNPSKVDVSRPIFCTIASITDVYGTFLRRSLRQGRHALVQDVGKGRFELFDDIADPQEQKDLAKEPEHKQRLAAMKEILIGSLTGNLRDHGQLKKPATNEAPGP